MSEIKFDLGGKSYNVTCADGQVREVYINTSDFNISQRMEESKSKLKELEKEYNDIKAEDLFKMLPGLDKKTREILNYIYGMDICGVVFGNVNTWTLAQSTGLPIWIGFNDAMRAEIIADISDDEKLKRFEKSLKKYEKK